MRKRTLALTLVLLVGLGVWYVVTTLPLRTTEDRAAGPRTAGPVLVPAQGAVPGGALPSLASIPCGGRCGSERWLVKTLSDPDRGRVRLEPVDATIEQLVGLHQPPGASDLTRAAPVELTVYRVEARLIALFGEKDGDFHLVLASPRDSTVTMIAEVPD